MNGWTLLAWSAGSWVAVAAVMALVWLLHAILDATLGGLL